MYSFPHSRDNFKVKLEISNSFCKLSGDIPQVVTDVLTQVMTYQNDIAAEVGQLFFQMKLARRYGNNKKFYAAKAQVEKLQANEFVCLYKNQRFPTGLLNIALEVFKELNAAVECIDSRQQPGETAILRWNNMPHEPRYYQKEMIQLGIESGRGVFEAAVGSGKSLVLGYLIKHFSCRSLVVVPSVGLSGQLYNDLSSWFGTQNVELLDAAKIRKTKKPKAISIVTVQSLGSLVKSGEFKEFAQHIDALYVDECFPGDTYVSTEDGPRSIANLVKLNKQGQAIPKVLCWNESLKIFEYKPVTHSWIRNRSDLVEIKYSKRRFRCTPNHKLLTTEGWKFAGDLKPGDCLLGTISTKRQTDVVPLFTEDQKSFMIGSYLGDGSIRKVGLNRFRLAFTHGIAQLEYAKWKAQLLGTTYKLIKNNGYSKKDAVTIRSQCFDLPIVLGTKNNCPQELVEQLDLKSLAVWYMDDGSWNSGYATLATCSFDEDSNRRLSTKLTELGFENTVRFVPYKGIRAPGYFSIFFSKSGTDRLSDAIGRYLHDSMSYKLPNYNGPKYEWDTSKLNYGSGRVDYVKPVKNKFNTVYDLEVADNHNFVVCSPSNTAGIVAHNCHHSGAATYTNLLTDLDHVFYRFGFSGTFLRNDNKELEMWSFLSNVLYRYPAHRAIEEGFLTPLNVFVHDLPGTPNVKYQTEYDRNYCANAGLLEKVSQIVNNYEESQILILVNRKDKCGLVIHEWLNSLGIENAYISGDNSKDEINNTISAFNEKKIRVLIGSSVIGEGIDVRSTDHLIMCQGGKSEITIVQAAGRVLRLYPGKTQAFIHDFNFVGTKYMGKHLIERVEIYQRNFQCGVLTL